MHSKSTVVAACRRISSRGRRPLGWLLAANSNHVIAIASLVMAAATIAYTVYARRQWDMMGKTLSHVVSNDTSSSVQTSKIVTAAQDMESHLKQMVADNKQVLSDNKKAIEDTLKENRDELARVLAQNRDVMKSSVEQSKAALDASIEVSRIDQRAWLSVSNLHLEKELNPSDDTPIPFIVSNSGKTPALNVVVKSMVAISYGEPPRQDWGQIAPVNTGVIFPGTHMDTSAAKLEKVRQMFVDIYRAHTANLYVRIRVEYEDVFNGFHWIEMCGGHPFGTPLDRFENCKQWGYIDLNKAQ